jgi:hypothetical protein
LVVDAEFGAHIVPEIKLDEITIKMFVIDVLIDADKAALEYREKAFERVHMHVVADVLALGMIDGTVFADETAVRNRAVRIESAVPVKMLPERIAHGVMVKKHRADGAAALDQAHNLPVLARRRIFRTTGLGRAVINVSSASTILPGPPIRPVPLLPSIAIRMRCIKNHAVFIEPPRVRCIWRVEMPFFEEQIS